MADQQPPGPPPESVILQQFAGMRNTLTRERLAADDLERGTNIDLDDAGQARRRRGYTLRSAGNFHSPFNSSYGALVVKNGSLGFIDPDYTHRPLVTVGQDPLAYVQIEETVYLSSRSVSYKFDSSFVVKPWGALVSEGQWVSPIVNPTPTLGAVQGKLLGAPPLATTLTYFNGRILLGSDKLLWVTEQYNYNLVDKVKGYLPFESTINCVGRVTDGIYVGTDTHTWFLSGTFPYKRILIAEERMYPGSLLEADSDMLPEEFRKQAKTCLMYLSDVGAHLVFEGGGYYNLTQPRMLFPRADSVAALFREQDGVNQYVAVTNSGGSPASAARIGDYVDAEIRRFTGA